MVEYDDVYVTEADWEAERGLKESAIAAGRDTVVTRQRPERRKMDPRLRRALVWMGGAMLEIGLNVALVMFLYN